MKLIHQAEAIPQSKELLTWIMSLTDFERQNLLAFMCGWKPEIIATLKAEREEEL